MNPLSIAMGLVLTAAAPAGESPPQPVHLEAALITLIEQADVAAREAGQLAGISAREGQLVAAGELLAQIDDIEAQLARQRAQVELEIAAKDAANEVKVRFAAKNLEVARAELRRAVESVERYAKSVSESELDQLRLTAERAALELEQARHLQEVAQLAVQQKQTELEFARRAVERCQVVAPLSGMVVQVKKRRGEWVEPGETVVRIVRIDLLRVEGFVHVADLPGDWAGRAVTLQVDLPGQGPSRFDGELVFVSPEVNPVNGQVRVWAEVNNRGLVLRPGLQGRLTIHPATPGEAGR
jgi:RND family efflux transporter MFP subunit